MRDLGGDGTEPPPTGVQGGAVTCIFYDLSRAPSGTQHLHPAPMLRDTLGAGSRVQTSEHLKTPMPREHRAGPSFHREAGLYPKPPPEGLSCPLSPFPEGT